MLGRISQRGALKVHKKTLCTIMSRIHLINPANMCIVHIDLC